MGGLLDDVLAKLGELPPDRLQAIAKQAADLTAGMDWIPNDGPQSAAFFSKADILLYGGEGGGGKTDLGLGLAFTQHQRSLVMRRKYVNLTGLLDRSREIHGERKGVNMSPPPSITHKGRLIQFAGQQHLGDEQDWMGNPFDFKYFDEATQFLEQQVRFHIGWVRSVDPAQRKRVVLGTNPPMDATGDWVIPMFAPWIDLTHPDYPEQDGKLRWYVSVPGPDNVIVDIEVDAPTQWDRNGDPVPVRVPGVKDELVPMSRTFIRASLSDNPYLINTGYKQKLDSLPEPVRSAVRDGNFMAGRQDDEWQVIPSSWVVEAQNRWTEQHPDYCPMSSIAADVARGGIDNTVLSRRWDGWFAPLIVKPGVETPLGRDVAGLVVIHREDNAPAVIDMGGGYGGAVLEHLQGANDVTCIAFNGAKKSVERTMDGEFGFQNMRSQAWWQFREALDPSQQNGSRIALPPDPQLRTELTSPLWTLKPGGVIAVETKEDVVDRLGRSTDRADAVLMAWQGGGRWETDEVNWRAFSSSKGRRAVVLGRMHQKRGRNR